MAGFSEDVSPAVPNGEDQPGDRSERDRTTDSVGFLRSIGRGGIWFYALYLAGLGLAFAVVGLATLSDIRIAISLFAFSIFFFLPLAWLLREPKSEREHPLSTSDISKDWRERAAVAGDPATSIDLLDRLAGDSMTAVRRAVATNPSTPRPTIDSLRKDRDRSVRQEAARRRLRM